MARKYKISLRFIEFCLFLSIIVLITYIQFLQDKKLKDPLVVVDNHLSINYKNGNEIKIGNLNNKNSSTFSVINTGEENMFYYIRFENVKSNQQNIKMSLVEGKDSLQIVQDDFSVQNDYIVNYIEIGAGETHNYEFTVFDKDKTSFSAEILVGSVSSAEEYFATTILNNNAIKKEPQTKVGEEAATLDEGLIEDTDDLGVTYYFRGNVLNNYVNFANLTWRVVRINGDGSVRLILNDYIDSMSTFYDTNNSIDDNFIFSNTKINEFLNSWYETNLRGNEKHIASSKFCLDNSTSQVVDNTKTYLGNTRLTVDYNQVFNCLATPFSSRIGLLTADEAVYAGATKNSDNTSFYLYTPERVVSWWTLTPSVSNNDSITYFSLSTNGKLENDSVGSYYRGVKPVINLQKKTSVTGSGTIQDPYKIKE